MRPLRGLQKVFKGSCKGPLKGFLQTLEHTFKPFKNFWKRGGFLKAFQRPINTKPLLFSGLRLNLYDGDRTRRISPNALLKEEIESVYRNQGSNQSSGKTENLDDPKHPKD